MPTDQRRRRGERRWPERYSGRVLVALPFMLGVTAVGWAVPVIVLGIEWGSALGWLALCGPVFVLSGSLAIASLARPNTPIRLWAPARKP